MKKKILLLFVFLMYEKVYSQERITLNRNSILELFKTFEPLKAQDSILNTNYNDIDFKSYYYDIELKSYFLKCLDQKAFFELKMKEEIDRYKKVILDTVRLKYEIKSYLLQRKRGKQFDSIIKSPKLTSKFKDSIILARMLLDRKNEKIENYYPPTILLVKLKYPEVYVAIQKWNLKNSQNFFFNDLMCFNDPGTQIIYEKRIKKIIKSKGKSEDFTNIINSIWDVRTSYVYKKAIDLLMVDFQVEPFIEEIQSTNPNMKQETNDIPFNCHLINDILMGALLEKNIFLPDNLQKELDFIKQKNDRKRLIKFYQKNMQEIKLMLLKLVKIKQKEEEYWMKNMPFYKK